jgi:predicted MFS family arabinose efflux permease
MTLCVFTLIASEFMPVSLLTPIAAALQVSEGWVGYGIAISGAFAVLTSLCISRLAGDLDRKMLLLGMTAVMGVSGLVVALATNYVTYMVGRALIGVVVGGFWSMSVSVAMRLVPAAQVPKALAIFNSGNALATVIAAPLGSYLGSVIGWRGAFFCLVPIAAVAMLWQWRSLPSLPPTRRNASQAGNVATPKAALEANVLSLLRRPVVALGMAAMGLFFMGQFELFTYVRPFLESVTQVQLPVLSLVLFGMGVAGFVGTVLVSRVLQRGMYRMLIAIPLLMAIIALALVAWGASLAMAVTLLALWALVATAAPVGWWSWLARTLPQDAEVGGGLMVAVIQLSIALGSTVGGLLFDGVGYRATFHVSAALLVAAAAFTLLTARQARVRD